MMSGRLREGEGLVDQERDAAAERSTVGDGIAVVLPSREAVTSGKAGAVALTVGEFGRVSEFRDRLLVVGGAEQGDYDLPYCRIVVDGRWRLKPSWPFWKRSSEVYADAVADWLLSHRCAVVEVHNQTTLFTRLALRLSTGTRLCLHLHNDPQDMRGMRTPAERAALLARASLVYCVSTYVRDRFIAGLQGSLDRVVVLHNGVQLSAPDGAPKQKIILFVGRLIPEKGLDALIGGLARVAPELPDWHVALIGQLPDRHRTRYAASLANLAATWGGRLTIPGFMAHPEVMQEYARAAITIVPSLWQEPFGRVALEAMAAGSAVIASRSGGLPEIVRDAGLLLPEVTPEALSRAILDLAHDPERRAVLGRAARSVAAEHFDVAILARRLDRWRRALLASRPGNA